MGIVRIARSALKARQKEMHGVEDSALTRRQSWRRQEGGVQTNWKTLDTGPFYDGQEYDRTRLEAWLLRRQTAVLTNEIKWVWIKLEANGFRLACKFAAGDGVADEVCMEDILGVMCKNAKSEILECEIDSTHERAAYFRRTNLHASEDASDIHSLVAQVEAEYLSHSGYAPQVIGRPASLLDFELTERDFAILTTRMGYFRGVPIIFRASCEEEKIQWVETLRRIIKFPSASSLAPLSYIARLRRQVYQVYTGQITQLIVAALICSNFLANIIEAQSSGLEDILESVDLIFTSLFTLELLVNLFATLVAEFFGDPWNYFDSIVVTVGLVTLAVPDMPGGSTLKLMRTFRVFRLFKRIPSLKHLVGSLFKAIPAMANAYVLMTILTSIYAILCVKFFRGLDGEASELFGDFFGAMFTLWQVMTGDDWSKIVRDMFGPSGMPAAVALFFVSFQLIITFTMVNVVVCVLVDEFCGGNDGSSDSTSNDMPPVFCAVSRFKENNACRLKSLLVDSLACHDLEAFDEMMYQIWHSLCQFAEVANPDREETTITFEELVVGLRELPYCPPVMFSWQDWVELILRNELCNSCGLLTRAGFYDMVQFAIKRFGQNQLQVAISAASSDGWTKDAVNQYLYALKAKLTCVAENAMRQEEEMLCRIDSSENKPTERARFLNMRKLVWEFNRMQKRFIQVEHMAERLRTEKDKSHGTAFLQFSQRPAALPQPQFKATNSIKSSNSGTSISGKVMSKSEDGAHSVHAQSLHGSELSAAVTQSHFRPSSPPGFGTEGPVVSPIEGTRNF